MIEQHEYRLFANFIGANWCRFCDYAEKYGGLNENEAEKLHDKLEEKAMHECTIKIRETESGFEVEGVDGAGCSSSAAQMAAYMLTMTALKMKDVADETPDGFRRAHGRKSLSTIFKRTIKMAKNRIKQPAIEAAQDKAEVTAFIRQIGDLQREVKRLETEAGDKKAAIEEEYAAYAAPLCAEITSLTERVAAYCEAHKDELTENGKTKTVDFTTGLIKWRIRPPSVKVTGVAAVLAWLSEKSAFVEFVRTKKEIDKDAILNQKERFSDGQVPGIKIVSGVEDFVIEPTEQELG